MAQIVGERVSKGDAIVDYEDKVFEDIQAEPGEKAFILMHTVPFEGSVGLVNMLTATRRSATRLSPAHSATTSSCRPSWTRAAMSTPADSPPLPSMACARST